MERVVISRRMRPRKVERAVAGAGLAQWHEDLPPRLLAALAEALADRPEVQLYYNGFAETPPLEGFEHLERITLNMRDLKSLEPLARFTRLRSLGIGPTVARLDLSPLTAHGSLEHLSLPGRVSRPLTLRSLTGLRSLETSASQALLDALVGHPALEYLDLKFGSATDLGALATMPALRDLEIWQIQRLDSPTLRYLMLEKVPSLDTLAPLAELELRALGLFESRPADRSLRPLPDSLRDVSIGDVYPKPEVEALVARLPDAGISLRGRDHGRPSLLRWRSLMSYVLEDT